MNVEDSFYSLYCTVIPDSGLGVLGLPVPECYFCEFVCGQVPKNFEETRVSHVQQATYITVPNTTI